jgi:hypothetical protein
MAKYSLPTFVSQAIVIVFLSLFVAALVAWGGNPGRAAMTIETDNLLDQARQHLLDCATSSTASWSSTKKFTSAVSPAN